MFECVVNVAEGRDARTLAALADACGRALLDVHVDADHHRSVFTLGAADAPAVAAAVRDLARAVARRLDLGRHRGVHPRLGALDVVPFVALAPSDPGAAVAAAHETGRWLATTLGIPVFFYDRADARGRTLPETRRDAFVVRPPDLGPPVPHDRLGAAAVGARAPLVAVNVELDGADLAAARAVAKEVRARDGGLPGVRALGLELTSRGRAQVSMNLVDLDATGLETACSAVRDALGARGLAVARVEVVGLVPDEELARSSDGFRAWARLPHDLGVRARAGGGVAQPWAAGGGR